MSSFHGALLLVGEGRVNDEPAWLVVVAAHGEGQMEDRNAPTSDDRSLVLSLEKWVQSWQKLAVEQERKKKPTPDDPGWVVNPSEKRISPDQAMHA
jgi:hypothetical protein